MDYGADICTKKSRKINPQSNIVVAVEPCSKSEMREWQFFKSLSLMPGRSTNTISNESWDRHNCPSRTLLQVQLRCYGAFLGKIYT